MKITKKLEINGEPYNIASDDVRLSLFAPGVADFVIESAAPVAGIVKFSFSNSASEIPMMHKFFIGAVENCVRMNNNRYAILCRELSDALRKHVPLALRHCTLNDVLLDIHKITGLVFRTPDTDYTKVKLPWFYNTASGIHALDQIGKVYNITDYIWQQQGNGEIFVGSWHDSYWADKDLPLPPDFFKQQFSSGWKSLIAVPGMRPGVKINGEFVTDIRLAGNNMELTCVRQLSAA